MEASLVAAELQAMDLAQPWNGKATELLRELERRADDATKKRRGWPADGARLSGQLRRLAPNLRAVGIEVQFDNPKRRDILIKKMVQNSDNSDTRRTRTWAYRRGQP